MEHRWAAGAWLIHTGMSTATGSSPLGPIRPVTRQQDTRPTRRTVRGADVITVRDGKIAEKLTYVT